MAGNMRVGTDLTAGAVSKTLLMFSLPIVLSNVVQQAYILADLMIIGRFVGSIGTVAVSTGGEMGDLMGVLAIAFSSAGQVFIAQLIGTGDKQRVQRSARTLLALMVVMSLVAAGITIFLCNPILQILQCPQEAWEQAENYMVVTALGIPFVFGYNAVCGVLRGMGESRWPLIIVVITAGINVLLDLFLVGGLQQEAIGAAAATTGSQIGAFTVAFLFLCRNQEVFGFRFSRECFRPDLEIAKTIIRQAVPTMVRIILVRFSMMWVNSNINSYGVAASSANSIGNRIYKFMETFMFGAETATSAIVGQNLGAKKAERAKKAALIAFGYCAVVAVVSSLLFLGFPRVLYGIFASEPEVLDLGVTYLQAMSASAFVAAIISSFQAVITGCGNATLSMVLGIVDSIFGRIGFCLLFAWCFDMGVAGFIWGHALARIISGTVALWYFLSGRWKKRKLLV